MGSGNGNGGLGVGNGMDNGWRPAGGERLPLLVGHPGPLVSGHRAPRVYGPLAQTLAAGLEVQLPWEGDRDRMVEAGTGLQSQQVQLPDGRTMRTVVAGSGDPLVVFEGGIVVCASMWTTVQRLV